MKRLIGILLCCALLCAAALAEGEGWTLDFDPNEAGYDGGWIGCESDGFKLYLPTGAQEIFGGADISCFAFSGGVLIIDRLAGTDMAERMNDVCGEGWRAAALNGHEAALGFMKDTDNACMCWPEGDTLYHFLLAPAVAEGGSAAARAFALRVLTSVSAM